MLYIYSSVLPSPWFHHMLILPYFFYRGHKYSKEFGGFRFLNPLATNKNGLTLGSIGLRKTSCFSVKGDGGVIAAQKSDIEVVIAQKSEEGAIRDDLIAGESFSINGLSSPNNEIQADEFFVDNGEFDLDCPTKGFDSIAEALEDIRQGKVSFFLFTV